VGFVACNDEPQQAEAYATQSALQFLGKFYGECQIVELTRPVCMANFTNRFNYVVEDFPNLEV
jgi:alkylhydroperoxidase family enzyme